MTTEAKSTNVMNNLLRDGASERRYLNAEMQRTPRNAEKMKTNCELHQVKTLCVAPCAPLRSSRLCVGRDINAESQRTWRCVVNKEMLS